MTSISNAKVDIWAFLIYGQCPVPMCPEKKVLSV